MRLNLLLFFLSQWSSYKVSSFSSHDVFINKHLTLIDGEGKHQNRNHNGDGQQRHPNTVSALAAAKTKSAYFINGPPEDTKPNYDEIHGPLGADLDRLFLVIFRSKMAEKLGLDSKLPKEDYQGLIELTTALNARYAKKEKVQDLSQAVLQSLFPSWLPGAFGVMFATPFPQFSSRMNAWATWVAGTWLMGECEINDCEVDGGDIGRQQGLLVKRCRFLEESGCASVCVNSCKIPTQKFFNDDMKLPLTMTPDYETGECQFSFGLSPTKEEELEAMNVPCLAKCPSSGGLREWHSSGQATKSNDDVTIQPCHDMFDK